MIPHLQRAHSWSPGRCKGREQPYGSAGAAVAAAAEAAQRAAAAAQDAAEAAHGLRLAEKIAWGLVKVAVVSGVSAILSFFAGRVTAKSPANGANKQPKAATGAVAAAEAAASASGAGKRAAAAAGAGTETETAAEHLAISDNGDLSSEEASLLARATPCLQEFDGYACSEWFELTFGEKDYVPWGAFWMALDNLVLDPTELGDERWQYFKYNLRDGKHQQRFQKFICQNPETQTLLKADWLAAADATAKGKLAELLKLGATSVWSDWVSANRGERVGEISDVIQAKSGLYISEWHVYGAMGRWHPSSDGPDTIMMSVRGQASDSTMLPEVKAECKDAAVYVQEPEIVKPRGTLAGFSTLWGTGRGGWLIGFMDCPENIGDSPWRIQADRLRPMVPEGRVVGYQMRAHDKVDSMRFLFRPFKQDIERPIELVNAVFISHTGSDEESLRPNVTKLVESIYTNLVGKGKAAFFDARSIRPGFNWAELITKWVRQSKAVVVVLSPAYPTRKWPLYELSETLKHNERKVYPVLFGVKVTDLEGPSKGKPSELWMNWQAAWEADSELAALQPAQLLNALKHHQAFNGNGLAFDTSKGDIGAAATDISNQVCKLLAR